MAPDHLPTSPPGAAVLPAGLCDCCKMRPADRWFGDASLALCNAEWCRYTNVQTWSAWKADVCDDEGWPSGT